MGFFGRPRSCSAWSGARRLSQASLGSQEELTGSHFYSRRYLAYMFERYGPEVVAELDGLRTNLRKVSDGELWRLLGELLGPAAAPAR